LLKQANKNGSAITAKLTVIMVLIIIVGTGVSIFFSIYISSLVGKPISRLSELIADWSRGRLDNKLNLQGRTDELGIMAAAANEWVDDLKKLILSDGGKVLKAAADKDLTQRLTVHYHGEYGVMKTNINSLVDSLDDALNQVREAATNVASEVAQISAGAQSLAQGSSQQASSLEQVSASLDQISAMTKQNAEDSNTAKDLAEEARSAANEGDASMKQMAEAINQIKQSADNTAKIIKSIDDIAFQTNLLALNAAVEAARAGEAGKGFAVVAEEVRNLAMRSAEAAKNTADLIEQSVKNADNGVKITEEVAKSLTKIVDRADKVGNLIAGIATASSEQSTGIHQVTNAVSNMNQVTQSNAANAEESAAAVEELNSLAEELQDLVNTFKLSTSRGGVKQYGGGAHAPTAKMLLSPAKSVRAVTPEEIIPMDDADFQQF
jgi:methyl-accepting chemotaxis protein